MSSADGEALGQDRTTWRRLIFNTTILFWRQMGWDLRLKEPSEALSDSRVFLLMHLMYFLMLSSSWNATLVHLIWFQIGWLKCFKWSCFWFLSFGKVQGVRGTLVLVLDLWFGWMLKINVVQRTSKYKVPSYLSTKISPVPSISVYS